MQFLVNVESEILAGGTVLGVQSVSCLVNVQPILELRIELLDNPPP